MKVLATVFCLALWTSPIRSVLVTDGNSHVRKERSEVLRAGNVTIREH